MNKQKIASILIFWLLLALTTLFGCTQNECPVIRIDNQIGAGDSFINENQFRQYYLRTGEYPVGLRINEFGNVYYLMAKSNEQEIIDIRVVDTYKTKQPVMAASDSMFALGFQTIGILGDFVYCIKIIGE